MINLIKIIGSVLQRFNGLLALLLTVVIILIMGAQGFVFWLNTQRGGDWLSSHFNQALKASGYEIVMDNFTLAGFFGLKAKHVNVKQNGSSILTGEAVIFSINPLPIGMKTLNINFKAQMINFISMPETKEVDSQEKAVLSELPDLYFKKANINLDIKKLLVSNDIVEGGFEGGIQINQSIDLKKYNVTSKGDIQLSNIRFNQADYLPNLIKNDLQFDLETQKLNFKEITFENNLYQIKTIGAYHVDDSNFNVKVTGQVNGAQNLNRKAQTPIKLHSMIQGNIDDFTGTIAAQTTYEGIKTTVDTNIQRKNNTISLKEIIGAGGPISVLGHIDYNMDSGFAIGKLDASLSDLKFLNNFVSDLNLSGSLKASANIEEKNGKQNATLTATLANMLYDKISVQKIVTNINFADVKNIENINADVILTKGNLDNINLQNATLNVSKGKQGYQLNLKGNGESIKPFLIQAKAIVKKTDFIDVNVTDAALMMGKGRITAQGDIITNKIDMKIAGEKLDFSKMAFVDLSSIPIILNKFDTTIEGSIEAPVIKTSYNFKPTIQEEFGAQFIGTAFYQSNELRNELSANGRGIKIFNMALNIPLNLSFSPFVFDLNQSSAINGTANIESDLRSLSSLFLDEGYEILGDLAIKTDITGSLSNPLLDGFATLKNSMVANRYNNIELRDINGEAIFKNRQIELTRLNAKGVDNEGTITVKGTLNLTDFNAPDIRASLTMRDIHLLKNENYDAWLNADINLNKTGSSYIVSGELSPQEISIRIPDQFDATIPELNIIEVEKKNKPTDSLFSKTKLDIKFIADNKIFVTGRGLDTELKGNLNVEGTLKTPLVTGNLNTIRGRYEEFGRRFSLDKASLRFQGLIPPSPYLDIEASTDVDNITAKVLISSSVTDPQIRMESNPPLPDDEIISLILFGKDVTQISPFQAIQLANTVRRFSGAGGSLFDPLQEIKSVTGLDDVYIEGTGAGGTTVGAGKYVTDKVYVGVEQGTAENTSSANIEVEVTPSISVESKAAQNGESDIGVFWEWNY